MKTSFVQVEIEAAETQVRRLQGLLHVMTGMHRTVSEGRGYRPEYVAQMTQELQDIRAGLMYAELVVKALKGPPVGDHPGR